MQLNRVPEPPKRAPVISNKNLPTKFPVITYTVLYNFASEIYQYPAWLDVVAYSVLGLIFMGVVGLMAKEDQVDVFKE